MSLTNIYDLNYYDELIDNLKDSIAFYMQDKPKKVKNSEDMPYIRHVDLIEQISHLNQTDLIFFKFTYMMLIQSCITEIDTEEESPVEENKEYSFTSERISIEGNNLRIKLNNGDIYNINLKDRASIKRKKKKFTIRIPSTKHLRDTVLSHLQSYVFAKEVNDNNIYSIIKKIQTMCKTTDAFSIGELAELVLSLNSKVRECITYKTFVDEFLSMFHIENKEKKKFILRYQFEKVTLMEKK